MSSSGKNNKFMQEIKRGDKEIDEIKAIIEFCTMSPELRNNCIEKTRDAMKTTLENNFSWYLNLCERSIPSIFFIINVKNE